MVTKAEIEKKEEKIVIAELIEDLEDLKRYLQDILNFIPLPLAYLNPRGIILEANVSFGKLFSTFPENLIGKRIEKVFKGALPHNFSEKVINRRFLEIEISFSPKGKEKKFYKVLANTRRTPEGEIIGYYFLLVEITELIRLQRALKEEVELKTKELQLKLKELSDSRKALLNILADVEEERKKAEEERTKVEIIIDSLADGLIFFSFSSMKVEVFNTQAEKIFKIKRDEILGKEIEKIEKDPILKEILKKLSEGIEVEKEEIKFDEDKIFELSIIKVGRGEKVIGFSAILHDVSREKFIEKLKSEFVSIAAHQLRTPLSAIKWTLKMLLDQELGKLNRDQLDLLEKSYQANERMISLINDLLNVARIEEGRYVYNLKKEDIVELIKEIALEFEDKAKMKDIKFGVILPEKPLPLVSVDREKIKLAISNLVDNAIKYTLPGGVVTLSVSRYNKKEVLIIVQDTGVGIPKDQQERVFTRFFRGANVLRMETSGTGLGLYITKNIIEAHGGKIWFESEEGKGSKFFVKLPISGP